MEATITKAIFYIILGIFMIGIIFLIIKRHLNTKEVEFFEDYDMDENNTKVNSIIDEQDIEFINSENNHDITKIPGYSNLYYSKTDLYVYKIGIGNDENEFLVHFTYNGLYCKYISRKICLVRGDKIVAIIHPLMLPN